MFLNLQHHHCHQGRALGQDWLTAAYIPYTWQEAVKDEVSDIVQNSV